jgi:hypothetical protein
MSGLRARPAEIALVAGAGLAALLAFLIVRHTLIDDAFITLDYARNLALHLHWGLLPGEVANTATSPLNIALLAAADELTRAFGHGVDAVAAVGVVTVGYALVMAWSWTRIVRAFDLPLVTAAVGMALVLANPFLLSALGLEVLLAVALLMALVAAAVEGRPGRFGVVAALALLTRLDLIVFVLAIAAATRAIRRGWKRAALALALVAGPWFVFSWIYLGSAVPDTLLIKTSQRAIWTSWGFFNGPAMYVDLAHRGGAVALAFAPAVLGLVALFAWRAAPRPVLGLAAGGVAYYLVLAALDPGPYHWYYVPPVAALSTFAAIAAGAWLVRARDGSGRPRAIPVAAVGSLAALALVAAVTDVTHGTPWRSPVITTNFADAADYERVGRALRGRVGRATVASYGEIGTLAYYCECRIVDEYSDQGYVVHLVERQLDTATPPLWPVVALNYVWFDRDRRPPRVDFRLAYAYGLGSGGDVWNVWSPWNGLGHIRLIAVH